jgi:diguanylate cyclase (GGDEF)-like protein
MEMPGSLIDNKLTIIFILIPFAIFILIFHYVGLHKLHSKWKLTIETLVMVAFITSILWFTGKLASPLFSLYFLVIITTAVTLGKNITLLEVGVISACCFLLVFSPSQISTLSLTQTLRPLIQLFPLWLVAYLAAMLSKESASAKKKIEVLSQTDYLTGLWNMRMFSVLVKGECKRALRYCRPFSIMMVDADNLKKVNDTFGHEAGSGMIKHLGSNILEILRSSDIVARYGGDEFVAMLPETSGTEALNAGERLRGIIQNNPLELSGKKLPITVSIGIACYPDNGSDIQEITNRADKAMYESKTAGKNKTTLYSGEQQLAFPTKST